MSLIQFEEIVVQEAMLDLDVRKGPGPDGISPFVLNKLVSVMYRCRFCSICLYLLVFSLQFGKSFIVSIFKNGKKCDISCYRLKKWSAISSHRLSALGFLTDNMVS
jgi:hypothetical protein